MALYKYFKYVSKNYPECPLSDQEGLLSSKVPSSCIRAANLEVKPLLTG